MAIGREKLDRLNELVQAWELTASEILGKIVQLQPIITEDKPESALTHDVLAMIIKNITANTLHVSIKEMESDKRDREFTEPRYICFRILQWSSAKYSVKISLKKIGSYFSDRDHSTVLKGLTVYQDLYETDPKFRNKADMVLANFIKYIHRKDLFKRNQENQIIK